MHRHTLSLRSRLTAGFAAGFFALLVAGSAAAIEYTSQDIVTLRASAAHTTDLRVRFVNDGNHCGAYIYMDWTVEADTATITVTFEIVEPIGGLSEAMDSMTAVTAIGEYIWVIHPVMDATLAGVDDNIVFVLPQMFDIFMNHSDADAATYTMSIQFIKSC